MLDDNAKAQLRGYLGRLQHRVELVASLDDSTAAAEMRELLDEIAAQSELVSVRHDGHAERRPSFQITRAGAEHRHRLRGDPDGPRVHLAGAGACCRPAATRPRSPTR